MSGRSREKDVLAIVGLATVGSLTLFVHPWYVPIADASIYIATARSIVAGEGYSLLGEAFVLRPPGFSLLLAPVIALRGTDFYAMNLLVSLTGLLGVAFLYALQRERLGWPLALLVSLAVWLNPGYQGFCNQVMSDVPGVAAALGCLCLERAIRSSPSRRQDWLLGLLVGLASIVRSSNLLLIPAVLVSRWLSPPPAGGRRPGRIELLWFRPAIVALLVALPWMAYQQTHLPSAPADQTRLYSYASGMFHADPGDPGSRRLELGEIAARVPLRMAQVLSVLGTRMGTPVKGARDDPFEVAVGERMGKTGIGGLHAGAGAFLLLGLAWALADRRETPEIFAFATLGFLLVYFGFQDRLILPIYMIALPATVSTLRDIAARALSTRRAGILVGSALALLVAADFAPRARWSLIEAEHQRVQLASHTVAPHLPPGGNIAAWRGFHHGVLLERPIYSLHHSVSRLGAREGVDAVIQRYGIDTIFLTTRGILGVKDYLAERYGPPLRDRGGLVWRVAPESVRTSEELDSR
jgi:hypothetical protein